MTCRGAMAEADTPVSGGCLSTAGAEEVVDQVRSIALRYLTARRVPTELAKDLASETVLRVWRKLRAIRNTKSLGRYVRQTAYRLWVDHLRTPRREHPCDDALLAKLQAATSPEEDPALAAIRLCLLDIIVEELDRLPQTYRQVVTLSVIAGFTTTEIHQFTGVSHDAVRQRLTRGLKMLKAAARQRLL